jgi:hypothetical protein
MWKVTCMIVYITQNVWKNCLYLLYILQVDYIFFTYFK